MTANILSTELSTIIQESKRKNAELRTAAEQSLQELKALPSTSESQLAADLRRRPHFISPFLAACQTRNVKLSLPAVSCLQRLIVGGGLASERLGEVLEAFSECVAIALELQLKMLQCLPSLLQNYADVLEGDLQANVFRICTSLQQVKTSAVSSTASATLQQAVAFLYEKVESEDAQAEGSIAKELHIESGPITLRPAAWDAYRILEDICLLSNNQPSQFVRKATLAPFFGLELIESLLLNHANVFHNHPEQANLLLTRVMPLINRIFSERLGFAISVRAVRILCILLREHLAIVNSECEIALGLLNHMLEADNTQPWRRALCLEAYRVIYSNSDVVLDIYAVFDEQENRRSIVQDCLSAFVRLAAEKPALIGLGQQSSVPSAPSASRPSGQSQAVAEAEAAAGMIGSDFGVNETNVPGISAQWSSMKVPCLDQLDKTEGPQIPETYPHSLVLACINGLSDALAQVILPLTVQRQHRSGRKARSPLPQDRQREQSNDEQQPAIPGEGLSHQSSDAKRRLRTMPANPMDLTDHPSYASVKTVASLINSCWPAVLATSSTFFNAALDTDFYRSLVRSFQKLCQVAGLLRLATPRDALLTTLAKTAVPPSFLKSDAMLSPSASAGLSGGLGIRGIMTPTSENFPRSAAPDTPTRSRRSSLDLSGPALTQRNMMCLRALVHLAIALGPILDQAWSIVLETVQKADVVIAVSGTAASARDYRANAQASVDNTSSQPTLSSEIAAVEAAMARLFQSTSDYPKEAFEELLTALCDLLKNCYASTASPFLQSSTPSQRRLPSVSGLTISSTTQPQYGHFAIAKLGDLSRANNHRLTFSSPDYGWEMVTESLLDAAVHTNNDPTARTMAGEVLAQFVSESSESSASEPEDTRHDVQQRCFVTLAKLIRQLYKTPSTALIDQEVHQTALSALRTILELCGEALVTGWSLIFEVVKSAFHQDVQELQNGHADRAGTANPISAKLARTAFSSLQLICSDFLVILPATMFPSLADVLSRFSGQSVDMNISLSAITLFWNLSDFLKARISIFELPNRKDDATQGDRDLGASAREGSVTAMWLLLHQQLALLAADDRADVRNGSIHILFRTLDACGDKLDASMWEITLHAVVFRALGIDSRRQTALRSGVQPLEVSEIKSSDGSSQILIEGTARIFATHMRIIQGLDAFGDLWQTLLELIAAYINCGSYELVGVSFSALTSILASAADANMIGEDSVKSVASLWARGIPGADEASQKDTTAQERALAAYVNTAKQVHRLLEPTISGKQVINIIDRLQDCILASAATPYANDATKETNLQVDVLDCLSHVKKDAPEVSTKVLQCLSKFASLPYEDTETREKPTFVAFAKHSISMLREQVASFSSKPELYSRSALLPVIQSLQASIQRKYSWQLTSRDPPLWRHATSAAVAIIEISTPKLSQLAADHESFVVLWTAIIELLSSIEDAQYDHRPDDDVLIPDETFDLDAASSIRRAISPLLNMADATSDSRTSYLISLFEISTIHPSRYDNANADMLSSDLTSILPELLSKRRFGRTYDPPFNPRIRMAYACLDELFDLVDDAEAQTENESNSNALALAAFSYLVLRCAVPLKRYTADQPLRGRLPTPMSQRLELLHILGRVARLNCKSEIGAKEHLVYLAPLVNEALEHASMDFELAGAMRKVLDVVFRSR